MMKIHNQREDIGSEEIKYVLEKNYLVQHYESDHHFQNDIVEDEDVS